ncbi:hypothetical protein WDU94_009280 [Cyamophila willieti]
MQKNGSDCRPLVNRRKALLYSAPRYITVPQDDTYEIPTVVDQLLEYNRKVVAMEKAEQSSSSQAQNLPRLRRRPKQEVQDDKPVLKRGSTGKDSVGSKSPVPNEKGPKRSLRSNAGQDVAPKVKLRSSLKNEDTCKKLSPGKKILKKVKGVTSAKKGNHSVAEESVLRNGKRKRKAKSPVFPEKDIKKKIKKVIDDSNSSSSTPSDVIVNFLNDEELEDEDSVLENVKVKRLSLDDVTSINSKSESEEKDNEDNVKKDSEILSKVSNQMKIKNRKKKSRSIEKTGGNIWAVDSNGSELVISDTTSNTSRRSSFNSISSENNSNSLDVKIEHPSVTSSTTNQQDQDTKPTNIKTDSINECPPIVKTQLVVPFLINNKPVLKVGNAIKKIVDDTTDYTDSDNLVIDTDDEESVLFKPKTLSENKLCNTSSSSSTTTTAAAAAATTAAVIDINETEQKSVATNESEDRTNLVNHNDNMELELLNETECKPKCDDTKPKNTAEEQEQCDIKQIDKEVTNNENSDGILVKNLPASSATVSTKVVDSAPSISNTESSISLSNSALSTSISTSVSSSCVSNSVPSSSISNSASNTSLPDVINTFVNDDDSTLEDSRPKRLSLSLPSKTTEEIRTEAEVSNEEKMNIINGLQSEKHEGDLSLNMESCIENIKSDEITPTKEDNQISDVVEENDESMEKDAIENKPVDKSDKVLEENISEPLILPSLNKEDNECKAEEIEKSDKEQAIENEKDRLICVVNNPVDENQSDEVLKEDESKKSIRPTSTLIITKNNNESKAEEIPTPDEPFLNPETGLLENVNDWEKKKDETTQPVGALLNVAVDNKIEKVQGNFISPDSISTKDENLSLYEDTEMVDAEKKGCERNEEKELELNESISTEFTSFKDETMLPDNELEEIAEHKFSPLEVPVTADKKTETPDVVPSTPAENQVEVKNTVKGILLDESDDLRELEDHGSNLIEIKKKVDFLKNLKLHSSNPLLGQGQEKKAKICFGVKDSSSEKDENYTGTLKVTLTRKRDGEKKKCDTDTKEEETTLEYKICPKRIHKVNYKNLPLTLMYSLASECPQSPPISFYKPNNHYKQDYSFRVLTYVGPVEKDDVTPSTSGQDSSANGSGSTQADADSEKPTRKKIVIPEKSSSFQIHPKRFCDDVCMYCRTKFGTLDTPCHIAQLKSVELQNQVIKSGTNLEPDSCLCDACYRRVIRMSQEKTKRPPKKKKKRSRENVPCQVPDCMELGNHTVTKRVLQKIRRTLRNKLNIEMERLTSGSPLNLCNDHYHWVLVALRCFVCEKRQSKQVSEPRAERVVLKAQLENEGIEVQAVDNSIYMCKMCKYFCSLLLKKNHMTHSAKDFFDSYKVTLINKKNSKETSDHDTVDEKPGSSDDSTVASKTETETSMEAESETKPESSVPETATPSETKTKSPLLSVRKLPLASTEEKVETLTQDIEQQPLKLPGEDEIVLETNLDISKPAKSSSATLERFNTTIQFDSETKKLYQSLLRPYGNQSSFLRHLVILEKYFREGNLVLKEGASSKAQRYINTVNNRIQACNGTLYSPVSKNPVESTPTPPTPVSIIVTSGVNVTSTVTSNGSGLVSTAVNQIALTPEVSVLPATNVSPVNKLRQQQQQQQKFPQIQRSKSIKFVKNKFNNSGNPKPPMPGLNPIEKCPTVEIISSPEISLYNIPADSNGGNSKRMRMSPSLEITPDVSISKTFIPKMKSISSSIPISQSNLPPSSSSTSMSIASSNPNTSQPNLVFLLPPSSLYGSGNSNQVTFSQPSNMQASFDPRRQAFSNSRMPSVNTSRVSKAGTPPQLLISHVRSLAPSMQNNSNIRPRRNSNELRFPMSGPSPPTPTSGELLLAAFPTLVNNNITVRGPNPTSVQSNPNQTSINLGHGPIPNHMIFPQVSSSPRTSFTPQVLARSIAKNIRSLLKTRPDLQTNYHGNKGEP